MTTETLCPECGSERTDFTKVCPACGAPPAPEHRQGETPGGVRGHDLEPYITLRYIAKLFKVLAVLIIVMLVGEVVTGLLIDGTAEGRAAPELAAVAKALTVQTHGDFFEAWGARATVSTGGKSEAQAFAALLAALPRGGEPAAGG